MKGFLQSIGVLEKDSSQATPAAPVAEPEAAPAPAPVNSAIPEPESQPEPIGQGKASEDLVQKVVNGLRSDLQAMSGLAPLFDFTTAVNRLKRVSAMKDRILTALDLVGHDAGTVLGFADRYRNEAKRVAEAFFMRCKAEIGSKIPQLLKDAEVAKLRMQGLKQQFEAAQRDFEEKNQLVVDADTELAAAEEAAHKAADILVAEFDETHKALKEALQ